jgi:hypothetical protein
MLKIGKRTQAKVQLPVKLGEHELGVVFDEMTAREYSDLFAALEFGEEHKTKFNHELLREFVVKHVSHIEGFLYDDREWNSLSEAERMDALLDPSLSFFPSLVFGAVQEFVGKLLVTGESETPQA